MREITRTHRRAAAVTTTLDILSGVFFVSAGAVAQPEATDRGSAAWTSS